MVNWAEISGLALEEEQTGPSGNWGRLSGLAIAESGAPTATMVKPPPPTFVIPSDIITLEASVTDPDTDPSLISIRFEKATSSGGPWTTITTTALGVFTFNWDTTGEALGDRFLRAIAIDDVGEGPPSVANKITFVTVVPSSGGASLHGGISAVRSGIGKFIRN